MRKTLVSCAMLALGAWALGGCYYGQGEFGRDDEPSAVTGGGPVGPSASTGTIGSTVTEQGEAEVFRGDLGETAGFVENGSALTIRRSSTSANVRVDAVNTGRRYWVMNALTIQGGLQHPSLQPGSTFRFTRSAPRTPSGLAVTVLGCQGPSRDNFTYDRSAETVEVSVSEGPTPDSRRMGWVATFAGPRGASQRVEGSFVYDPQ